MARASLVSGIVRQCCPRCREGMIFRGSLLRGFPRMNQICTVCGLKFERESGYFLGAMYLSYMLGVGVVLAITVLIWSLAHLRFDRALGWAFLIFLPLVPPITLFARVLWIYLDQTIDPDPRDQIGKFPNS